MTMDKVEDIWSYLKMLLGKTSLNMYLTYKKKCPNETEKIKALENNSTNFTSK